MEGSGNCREVRDELLIEVAEPNEQSYSLHKTREFPLLDGSEFGWVHPDISLLDNYA